MMGEAASETFLNLCDARAMYRDNRTSTPNREERRVCTDDNPECWDFDLSMSRIEYLESLENSVNLSLLSDPFPPGLVDSPLSLTATTDENADKESHPSIDLSYGGAWAIEREEEPSRFRRGIYDFGISVFDSSNEQVESNYLRTDQGLRRNDPTQKSKGKGSELTDRNVKESHEDLTRPWPKRMMKLNC